MSTAVLKWVSRGARVFSRHARISLFTRRRLARSHAQITYLLILHPIAAALAAVATILGLLAHLRGFGATCFTTCVASLAATVALLAFVFDIVVFLIAKKRIEAAASGESAELGNVSIRTLLRSQLACIDPARIDRPSG